MARYRSRSRPNDVGDTGLKLSEIALAIGVLAVVGIGIRYYFVTYRGGPAYALSSFIGAIKAGNADNQYALLDEGDKKYFPTVDDYQKRARWAQGFTERITGFTLGPPTTPDPKHPEIVKIEATISIRKPNQKIYESASDCFTDHYTMRKGEDGKWKVWLDRSEPNSLLKAEPTAAGAPL